MTISELTSSKLKREGAPRRYDRNVAASSSRRVSGPVPLQPVAPDSSATAREVTRRIVLNVFEALFRRPLLALLPLLLLTAAGVLSAASGTETYRSESRIAVSSDPLLAEITEAQQSFSFETAASVAAKQLHELISTDDFMNRVAAEAGWTDAVEQGLITLPQMRAMSSVTTSGDSIVNVAALTEDPTAAQTLASAIVTSFRGYLIETGAAEATTTVAFLTEELASVQERATAANARVDEFAAENPNAASELTLTAETEYQRLRDQADEEATNVREANAALREARLRERETETVVNQRFRVLDEPALPEAAQPRLKKMVLEVAMFVVLGSILSVLLLLLLAMFDRSIRTSSDVRRKFGLGVLALVPNRR